MSLLCLSASMRDVRSQWCVSPFTPPSFHPFSLSPFTPFHPSPPLPFTPPFLKLPQLLRDQGDDEIERLIHATVNSSKSRGVSYEIEDRLRQMIQKWQPEPVAMSTEGEVRAGEDGRHVTRKGIGCTCLSSKGRTDMS